MANPAKTEPGGGDDVSEWFEATFGAFGLVMRSNGCLDCGDSYHNLARLVTHDGPLVGFGGGGGGGGVGGGVGGGSGDRGSTPASLVAGGNGNGNGNGNSNGNGNGNGNGNSNGNGNGNGNDKDKDKDKGDEGGGGGTQPNGPVPLVLPDPPTTSGPPDVLSVPEPSSLVLAGLAAAALAARRRSARKQRG